MPELISPHQCHRLFDWEAELERLELEAEQAVSAGEADPLTLFDAECSLDLVEHELAAYSIERTGNQPMAGALQRCSVRLRCLVARLQQLDALAPPPSEAPAALPPPTS